MLKSKTFACSKKKPLGFYVLFKESITIKIVSTVLLTLTSHFALMNLEHISSHEVMVTLSLTHNSNVLLIFLALKLYILTVTIPLTACLLLLHITHHFLTFLISYVNIFIYYFPLNAAGKFLSTHPSSLTDVPLTFAIF